MAQDKSEGQNHFKAENQQGASGQAHLLIADFLSGMNLKTTDIGQLIEILGVKSPAVGKRRRQLH